MKFRLPDATSLFAVSLAVLPLLVVPFAYSSAYSQKGVIALLAFAISCGIASWNLLRGKGSVVIVREALALSALPLIVVATLSVIGRESLETMLLGTSLEVGTLGFFLLLACAMYAGAVVRERVSELFAPLFALTTLFAISYSLLLYFFSITEDTTLGSWQQASILLGTSVAIFAALLDTRKGYVRVLYGISVVYSIALLYALFYEPAIHVTIGALVVVMTTRFVVCGFRSMPLGTVFSTLALVTLLFLGSTNAISAQWLGAKPSLHATSLIAGYEYTDGMQNMLIGSGPNTFGRAWEKYRPRMFNDAQLWYRTPSYGHSTATTFAITLGVSGFIALLIIPGSFAWTLIYAMLRKEETRRRVLPLPLIALAASVLVALFIDVVDTPLFLAGAFAVGAFSRIGAPTKRESVIEISLRYSRVLSMAAGLLVLAVGTLLFQISAREFIAAEAYARASHMSLADEDSLRMFKRAASVWKNSKYEMGASRAFLDSARARLERGDVDGARSAIDESIVYARAAVDSDPTDYEAAVHEGLLYAELMAFGYPGAEEEASLALRRAIALAPRRPDAHYYLALFLVESGNTEEARNVVQKALQLKPDYSEAEALLRTVSP